MPLKVEFLFDFGSPNAYLAELVLSGIERRTGVGRVRQPKPAARFEINAAAIGGPAPRVGEHSRDVLRELGCDDGAIDKMVAERSVRVAV